MLGQSTIIDGFDQTTTESSMAEINRFSFGGTAAIISSMAMMIGLDAANATKATILSGLLVLALADNLTDSLSIHIYQESERLEAHNAFIATLMNFATRLALSGSFMLLVLLLPIASAIVASVIWGLSLLVALTYMIARGRKVSIASEVVKHIAVALVVIFASKGIGLWILGHVG